MALIHRLFGILRSIRLILPLSDTADAGRMIPANQEQTPVIRRLDGSEKPLFLQHLLRLDEETRRNRFAMIASDDFLTDYAETSFSIDTMVYGLVEDGQVRASAELRGMGDGETAEAAFCVETDWRQRGIGTRMMEIVLQEARNRNIQHIYVNCLGTNRMMQALARKFEAKMSFQAGDVTGYLAASQQESGALPQLASA